MDDGARAISLEAGICDPVVLWDASLASSGMKVRIPGKAASDSDGKRPPNPTESDHRFRSKAATLLIG